jgi:hypothetical protein
MANYKLHIVRRQHKYIEFYLLEKLNKNKLLRQIFSKQKDLKAFQIAISKANAITQ